MPLSVLTGSVRSVHTTCYRYAHDQVLELQHVSILCDVIEFSVCGRSYFV